MVGEVFAGISGFKAMLDLTKSIKDMNDAAVRNTAVIELQGQILAAQEQQAALAEQVGALKKEIARFETWETESQKYELKNFGYGAFARVLKPEARGTAPPHWVCARCYGNRRVSVIQFGRLLQGQRNEWFCPECKTQIQPHGDLRWEP